jgi:hypothetical protein
MMNPTTLTNPMLARITGWATILAPILLLGSTVAYITEGEGINDGHVGGTIGVWSCFAFVLAFIGIYRTLEPVAPRAAPIFLAVAATGSAAGVGFNVDAILAAEFGRDAVDTATEDTPFTLLAFLPWGLFFPISLVATGVLLWRAGIVPRLLAGLVLAGGVLFVASRPERIDALAIAGDGVLIVALAPIGCSFVTPMPPATPARARSTRRRSW